MMNIIDIKALQQELAAVETETKIYIKPGIHENVKLTEAIVKPTSTGTPVLQMKFTAENGATLYYSEWLDEDKQEDAKKKILMSILQVLNAVVPRSILDTMVATNSVLDFAEKSVLVLNGFKDDVKLRLKAVYVKDKVTTPLHSKFPWIENMSISKEDSKIQMYPRDLVTPAPQSVQMPLAPQYQQAA